MTLQLLPVPLQHAAVLRVYWEPLLVSVAKRSIQSVDEMSDEILSGRVIAVLAWDQANIVAKALAGCEILKDSRDRLWCHVVWCTGEDMAEWRDLLDEIERWAREHMGCAAIRATHRTGWTRFLNGKGYRETHRVSEKELA